LVLERKPAAVVGLGGFASAPVVVAAARQRIPVILLEQNLLPGRATRWLARYATTLCLSFEESRERLPALARSRCRITGNPVREAIRALHGEGTKRTDIEPDTPQQLLILGGSLGAQSLNRAMVQLRSIDGFGGNGWRVLHQTGPG